MAVKRPVYLDANVLIPSITRGLLIIGAVTSDYAVKWSRFGEEEAERHQHQGASKISELRSRFGWDVLVANVAPVGMVDTDVKDQPHLSAAHAAGARLIITDNIKDFGLEDLSRLSMSAVTPDLFLSIRLDSSSYTTVLDSLARGRTRDPKTPTDIHRIEVARMLPSVANAFAATYGVTLEEPVKGDMTHTFRGVRCVRCEQVMDASTTPLCPSCS